jgi:hypothetical protein
LAKIPSYTSVQAILIIILDGVLLAKFKCFSADLLLTPPCEVNQQNACIKIRGVFLQSELAFVLDITIGDWVLHCGSHSPVQICVPQGLEIVADKQVAIKIQHPLQILWQKVPNKQPIIRGLAPRSHRESF